MTKTKHQVDLGMYRVPDKDLHAACDVSCLGFKTTEELPPYVGFIGQERAEEALRRVFELQGHGHNPFIIETGGSGRSASIRKFLEDMAGKYLTGWERNDWCYVYNFEDANSPKALRLARGAGRNFKKFVEEELFPYLQKEIPSIAGLKKISSDHMRAIEEAETKSNTERYSLQIAFEKMLMNVQVQGFVFSIVEISNGIVDILTCHPSSDPGTSPPVPITIGEFLALQTEQREELNRKRAELTKEFRKVNAAIADYFFAAQDLREEIKKLTIREAFGKFTSEARGTYPSAASYFHGLENFTANHYELFLPKNQNTPSSPYEGQKRNGDPFLPFRINVLSNGDASVPVVSEDNATFYNLFGKLEREGLNVAPHSAPTHMDIRAGSVHKANGGVLIVNAADLFSSGNWYAMQRVLLDGEVKIEDLASTWGISLRGLKPEPISVRIKVVLIGNDSIYHEISHSFLKEGFKQLFKIPVYFDYETERTPQNMEKFSKLIAGWCGNGHKVEGALHLDVGAVAKVIEYASRLAENQEMLSLNMRTLKDLCSEASCGASKTGCNIVQASHVVQALRDRVFRVDLPREKMLQSIEDGSRVVNVAGKRVGEMNGLAGFETDDFSFGLPMRITCNAFVGQAGVVSIDREVRLSGSSHDKGLLTLAGYLGWTYAQDKKLSLNATLSFEQSHGIDGDSASSVEAYTILSALSLVPLRQDIAATGAVSQKGEILAIGNVSKKTEGFYDVCKIKGLTGEQGVIIPRANLRNLNLRSDVLEAIYEGKFHIYAVQTVEQGMEILTGKTMGEKIKRGVNKGKYPNSTINALIDNKLRELAQFSQAGR